MISDCQYECPFCGEGVELEVDPDLEGQEECLIQDCSNCCRPAQIQVRILSGEVEIISIQPA